VARQDEIRARIATEALRLFLRQGFDETTVDEIASAAGVSRRTYFRYFASKDDTLMGALVEVGSEAADAARRAPAHFGPILALRDGLLDVVERYVDDPLRTRALVGLVRDTPRLRATRLGILNDWQQEFAEVVARRRRSSEPVLTDRLLASLAVEAYDLSIDRWVGDESLDLLEVMRETFESVTALLRDPHEVPVRR
jgi:AcrR family transcriptional regulator